MVAAGLKQVVGFTLSPGQAHDAPVGRQLLRDLGVDNIQIPLIMDSAYEGNETRWLAQSLGLDPVVQPARTRSEPWTYDTELYKRRNEIERLFGI
jgi:transposase